ncbi:hypothetical protein B0H19DRAFT_1076950 [Mycena capillaripes]|nr:hypothetical protein B0H19DRAFT_1076950 [Mycena capillaripes]
MARHPDFDANCHQMPTLSQDHLSQMYQGFQEEYGEDDEYLRLLKDYEEVHMLEAEPSRSASGGFRARLKKMERTLYELHDADQVEGMFVLCGSSVNVDNEIGHHFATLGLAEFTSVFKTGKDHPGLTPDNFLGMAKTFVCLSRLQTLTDDGLIQRDGSAQAPALPARHPTASRTTSRTAAQPSAPSASAPSTSTSAHAQPSTEVIMKAEDMPTLSRSQNDTMENRRVCQMIVDVSVADIGRDVMQQGALFRWKSSVTRFRKDGFVLINFPIDVRFPCQSVDEKATGSWRKPHRESLTEALHARSVAGQGMRPPPGATFTGTFYDVNARPAGQLYATRPGQAASLLVPAARRPAPSAPPSAPPAAPAASTQPTLPAGLDIASLIANIPPALLAASLTNALQQMQGPQLLHPPVAYASLLLLVSCIASEYNMWLCAEGLAEDLAEDLPKQQFS